MPLDTTSSHSPDSVQIAAEMAHCRATMLRIMDQAAEVAGKHHAQIMVHPAPSQPARTQPDPDSAEADAKTGASPAPAPRADLTLQFERAATVARNAAMLVRYFARPLPLHAAEPAESRVAKRRVIIRRVEDAIARQGEGEWAEHMLAEFHERIEMPEFDDELAEREVDAIIRQLLCDFGMDTLGGLTYWKRRTPADVATLAALAAKPPEPRPLTAAPPFPAPAFPAPEPAGRHPPVHPAHAVAAVLAHAGRLQKG